MNFIRIINIIIIFFITCLIFSCSLNPAEEKVDPIVVDFPDANFEALIRETLDIPEGDITNWDMWTIKKINGSNRSISDITGIKYCTGLNELSLQNNAIVSIEELSELVLLNYLDLNANKISDIKPLVDNNGIGVGNDVIYLIGNPLSDESILIHIPILQNRDIEIYSNAKISQPGLVNILDPNFLEIIREHLDKPSSDILSTDLESINKIIGISKNISNIYGIEFCSNLDTLDLQSNTITDLIPLYNLWSISHLNLNKNNISDIRSLYNLFNLKSLSLIDNNITQIDPIKNSTLLTYLSLENNLITNISILANLNYISYLNLSSNPINNFEPLQEIDSLKTLELRDIEKIEMNDISRIQNLQSLYLSGTNVSNIDSIGNLTTIQNLLMSNCNVSNIDSLSLLINIRKLKIRDNNISDITALSTLYNITELDLGNNLISDILPLLNNWGLNNGDYVLLQNNPLNEISINTYIPILQGRGVNVIY